MSKPIKPVIGSDIEFNTFRKPLFLSSKTSASQSGTKRCAASESLPKSIMMSPLTTSNTASRHLYSTPRSGCSSMRRKGTDTRLRDSFVPPPK